jgi:hypothetical protein
VEVLSDDYVDLSAPKVRLARLWFSPYEKIHSLGAVALAASLITFLISQPLTKSDSVLVFGLFGMGGYFIGWATLTNCWCRWRTGRDQLILLRSQDPLAPTSRADIDLLGRRWSWAGPTSHVDIGVFWSRTLSGDEPRLRTGRLARAYQYGRAVYWAVCSSLSFQVLFGVAALLYSTWLLSNVLQFWMSAV